MTGILKNDYLTSRAETKIKISGHVEWECPSNIALVKYWGKRDHQLPANPSVSFTLSESYTSLITDFTIDPDGSFLLEYLFEEKPNPLFTKRIHKYITDLRSYFPFLDHIRLKMNSHNSFPHSSGIASSASFFGAVSLAICSIEQMILGNKLSDREFLRKASFLARLGSGSASRSMFGHLVLWGETELVPGSSDEFAVPVEFEMKPVFRDFQDSILVISSEPKAVSSTTGHRLMKGHPFSDCRLEQAGVNLKNILNTLVNGQLYEFIDIVEMESLALHAMMMTSNPGYILFKPLTLEAIRRIREFRCDSGLPVGFSLDAGPNVHLLYPFSAKTKVHDFIDSELRDLCESGHVIHDYVGKGPVCNNLWQQ